jgi:hypothetical protein
MKFFFPDSQDLVDPSFDFGTERRSVDRLRQRDDLYAHEVFSTPAFDGLLVSKGIVDGFGVNSSRYSIAQRQRLMRLGSREFFRVSERTPHLPILGDCGAFTYLKEKVPPYTVEELLEFYDGCQFDMGISLDHVILAYKPQWDDPKSGEKAPEEVRERQQLTLELAAKFLKMHKKGRFRFEPLGAAQGWSPKSYAASVKALQKMGYRYIALGGMVPLKSPDILASLKAIDDVRESRVKLHLLGVTRTDHIIRFAKYGVVSFDSTSPLRQAFKDDKDNYYWQERTFPAIRIPQVEGNPALLKGIRAGRVSHDDARRLEKESLEAMKQHALGKRSVESVVEVLRAYEQVYDPGGTDRSAANREVLEARPWTRCPCDVCKSLGYHVILFRGAERNRRRGFHNLWVFYRQVRNELGLAIEEAA